MSQSKPTTFYDLGPELQAYATAKAAIFGVPFEGAVSYGGGTANGPAAVLTASVQVETFDHELGFTPGDRGIASIEPEGFDSPLRNFDAVVSHIDRLLPPLIKDGKFPVMIGGDHSVVPPALPHYLAAYPSLGILQIDAHADLRDSYDDNANSHACAMRRALDNPLAHLVAIGIRNLCEEEFLYQQSHERITTVWGGSKLRDDEAWREAVRAAIAKLPPHVYLTIDIDGLDPSIMPATGTPEPGGLTWQMTMFVLEELFKSRQVVGMDVNELAPIPGLHAADFLVAKLIYKAIGLRFPRP